MTFQEIQSKIDQQSDLILKSVLTKAGYCFSQQHHKDEDILIKLYANQNALVKDGYNDKF